MAFSSSPLALVCARVGAIHYGYRGNNPNPQLNHHTGASSQRGVVGLHMDSPHHWPVECATRVFKGLNVVGEAKNPRPKHAPLLHPQAASTSHLAASGLFDP